MIFDVLDYLNSSFKCVASCIQIVNPAARGKGLPLADDKSVLTMDGMPAVQRILNRNSSQQASHPAARQATNASVADV